MLARAAQTAEPGRRILEAIDLDILGRRQRMEGREHKRPELDAAREEAKVMYAAALQEAALSDAPLPSRDAIDEAERAIAENEARIVGLRDAITALEPERRRAIERQERAGVGRRRLMRSPPITNARILAWSSASLISVFSVHTVDEIRFDSSDCLRQQLAAPSQLVERNVRLFRRWNTQAEYALFRS